MVKAQITPNFLEYFASIKEGLHVVLTTALLKQVIDGVFSGIEVAEGTHPLLTVATQWVNNEVDANLPVIVAELAKLGITVTD